jgi:hypothetical protein
MMAAHETPDAYASFAEKSLTLLCRSVTALSIGLLGPID